MDGSKAKKKTTKDVCQFAKPGAWCSFCKECDNNELLFGKFYKMQRMNMHHFCLLLSAKLMQNGKDDEGILGFLYEDIAREIKRCSKLKCYYCGWCTATISCNHPDCRKAFHLPCGRRNGALNMFADRFQSYCKEHRPMQQVSASIFIDRVETNFETLRISLTPIDYKFKCKAKAVNIKDVAAASTSNSLCESDSFYTCAICYDDIAPYPTGQSIWPECCRKDSWLHRICLEKLALSAGQYHVRCPLCNNQKIFLNMLYRLGFYVPNQDASWELEDGAYRELLERPKNCFRTDCACPNGNSYSSSKNGPWKLLICGLCGSQAVHRDCDVNKGRKNIVCNRCLPPLDRGNDLPDDLDEINETGIILLSDGSDSDQEIDREPKEDLCSGIENLTTLSKDNKKNDLDCSDVFQSSLVSEVRSKDGTMDDQSISENGLQTQLLISQLSNTLKVFNQMHAANNDVSIMNIACKSVVQPEDQKLEKEKVEENETFVKTRRRSKKSCESENKPKETCRKTYYSKRDSVSGRFLKKSPQKKNAEKNKHRESSKEENLKNFQIEDNSDKSVVNIEQKDKVINPKEKSKGKRRIKPLKISNDLTRRRNSKSSYLSWSSGQPRSGVNVVLKDGKFCLLFEGKRFGAGNASKDKSKKRDKENQFTQNKKKNKKLTDSKEDIKLLAMKDNNSMDCKKREPSDIFSSKQRPVKNKLSPERGQKNITLFFKKTGIKTEAEQWSIKSESPDTPPQNFPMNDNSTPLVHSSSQNSSFFGDNSPTSIKEHQRKEKTKRKIMKFLEKRSSKNNRHIDEMFNSQNSIIKIEPREEINPEIKFAFDKIIPNRKSIDGFTTGNEEYLPNKTLKDNDTSLVLSDDEKDSGIAEHSDLNNSFVKFDSVERNKKKKRKVKKRRAADWKLDQFERKHYKKPRFNPESITLSTL